MMIDGRASVQFTAGRGFRFRVTAVDPKPTYQGWVWLGGYQLAPDGEARERREIFVQRAGLRFAPPHTDTADQSSNTTT
ncbi:hypothetical protein [Micromonospora sp. NBC_01813]|uniref:hypothetical protein n=1 Tax=Micromonospora sp. NBC_01813 TaxID=2975988 RepID=UPI002DDABD9F|nr:hypothetical protein [Micromonospora sp. NBC_01813]WSA07465.1 hypothetical protein OG958_24920 [Micromonospora sp. NBC_01813]